MKEFICTAGDETPGQNNPAEIDIEEYNREIDDAIARVKAGDFYLQEEVDEMSKDW